MSVSREEAVALGEGVTAGRLCVRGWSVFATLGHDSTHPITAVAHCYGPADAHLFAAAPRLRETVVGLHDRGAELTAELASLRAQVADVGWAGDWFALDGDRVRWLRVHGGTDDQTWHLIDEGAISPQASLWRDGSGWWVGRKPNAGSAVGRSAAAVCEALYPGLTPPAGCEL